ncbi:MAG: hypothetical protein GY909_15605 [Oligoflexia bacterium]|nr:hypothetical protein [Oligoflexia bacterium]
MNKSNKLKCGVVTPKNEKCPYLNRTCPHKDCKYESDCEIWSEVFKTNIAPLDKRYIDRLSDTTSSLKNLLDRPSKKLEGVIKLHVMNKDEKSNG